MKTYFQKHDGQLLSRKAARRLILFLICIIFIVFTVKINQVEKTELVSREGQTFEKATVVEILQDNLQADGTRVGEQKVVVRMDSGERKARN